MNYPMRRIEYDYPKIGDIWAWHNIEHYLLLEKVKYAPLTFNVIYLEEGVYMEDLPINPKDFSWFKVV